MGTPVAAFRCGRTSGVIEVAMGDPDLLQRQIVLFQSREQPGNLAAGIDDRGFLRLGAPHDGAVLVQRRHRYDNRANKRFVRAELRHVLSRQWSRASEAKAPRIGANAQFANAAGGERPAKRRDIAGSVVSR